MIVLGTMGRGLRRVRTAASSVPPRRRRTWLFAYGFLAPIVALFAFLRIIPIAYTAVLAFFNWSLVSPNHTFVGLDNFSNLLGDANFQTAFLNTTIIAMLSEFMLLLTKLDVANCGDRVLAYSCISSHVA